MATNRSDIKKQLEPGLNAVFGMNYNAVSPEHKVLYDIEKSSRAFEEEVMMTGLGTAAVKQEGSAIQFDDMQESYVARYQHATRALGFAITEEAMEDEQYATIAKNRATELARALANAKEVSAANLFNLGFTTLIGDGANFLDTAHPTVTGAQANKPQTDADLSETALENACIQISKMENERGILIAAKPLSLHIPVELKFAAHRVLKSELSTTPMEGNGGDNVSNKNDINALRDKGLFQRGIFVHNYFTDPQAWFIRTDIPNGTKMFVRSPVKTRMDEDFNTGNLLFKAQERYSFGVSDWRQWWGTTGL